MHLWRLLLAALAGQAVAFPTAEKYVVHERRDGLPVAWKRHSKAFSLQALPIRIWLKQRNLHHATRFIDDVADPDSPNYGTYFYLPGDIVISVAVLTDGIGKHWTSEQVANMFARAQERADRTIDWLVNSGIEASRIKHSVGKHSREAIH